MEKFTLKQLKEVASSRENVVAFLTKEDIAKIEELCNVLCRNKSFDQLVEAITQAPASTNKRKLALRVCIEANTYLREFRYRYDNATKSLYRYESAYGAYVYVKPCSQREYKAEFATIER